LTTLNTGRLSLPASCAATAKLALKVAREWSRLEDGIIDPSAPGPWIAAAEPGPSKAQDVHRHIG
jgi:alkylation response protein AidB-like acyl-CoA dehydrogenase